MRGLKNMGGFIGYIIGVVILLPLFLIGYNYFFIGKNDAEKYLPKYIANSEEILITIPDYEQSNNPDSKAYSRESYTTSMQTKNMGRDGSQKISLLYRVVLAGHKKKYFKIIMVDWYRSFWYQLNNNTVYAKVNREDLANPKQGTKENPLLIFSVRGAKKPLSGPNHDGNIIEYDTPKEQYEYNALMYLTYIMPKEEFKQRFEGGK